MRRRGFVPSRLALCLALLDPAGPARGETREKPRSWSEEKCVRYAKDWREALARSGREGLTPAFIERHDAFVTGGCRAPGEVCPRSEKDFALANLLTIRAMNAGMASTFLPFACPR